MEIDRGLKIRIAISVILVVILLAFFVERLSYHNVVSSPREPASTNTRVIEACDSDDCVEEAPKGSDGALIPLHTDTSGA